MLKYSKKIITRDRVREDGKVALCLQVFIGGERDRIALNVYCKPSDWDDARQEVKKSDSDHKRINTILAKYKSRADDIFWDAMISQEPMTKLKFREEIDTTPNYGSFLDWMEKEIPKEATSKEANTAKPYWTTLKHLKKFRNGLAFNDLTLDLIQEFDRHLKKEKMKTNSRGKYHRVLRKFILIAKKKLRRVKNPYEDFKIKEEITEPTWLNPSEITALVNLFEAKTLGDTDQKVLMHFLFQMVTSVRVGTLVKLRPSDIEGGLLIIPPTKNTRRVVRIPISEVAQKMIDNRDGGREKLFACYTDVTMNRSLKSIGKAAGIDKILTTHVARHTFGFMYLYAGGKLEELKEIMGHSKIETTLIYTHVDWSKKIEGVSRMQGVFKFDSSK